MSSFMDLQDCNILARAFERGCAYSTTEAATFAPVTNTLSVYRSTAKTIRETIDRDKITSSKALVKNKEEGGEVAGVNIGAAGSNIIGNISARGEKSSDSLKDLDITFGAFDSKCIPCDFRINFRQGLNINAALDVLGVGIDNALEQYLLNALAQIRAVIDMFRNLDRYVDLCAFKKFFENFVCIPDFARILAVLMALLMDFAFELSSLFDLVFSLIAPLFYPFLSNLVNLLERYLLMAVRPIECIVDSIINLLGKLDYNVLFQNVDNLEVSLFGKKQGVGPKVPGKEVKLKTSEVLLLDKFGITGVPDVKFTGPETTPNPSNRPIEFNLAGPIASIQRGNERAVVDAETDLRAVRDSAGGVDATDPQAYERYKQQERAARDKYSEAVKNRDLSQVNRLQQTIRGGFSSFKGLLFELVTFLREAVQKLEAFVSETVGEFKKLYAEFGNGSGRFIDLMGRKLALIQMIAAIKSILDFLKNGPDCEDENEEIEIVANSLSLEQGFRVFVDEQGNINIQEDEEDLNDALRDVVEAIGNASEPLEPPDNEKTDTLDPSEKIKSLIEFTGDPQLDTTIARAVEALTTPARVKFKCPLQTSVANAEKVNEWIAELNVE